jgi:hypothetical protein
MRNNRFNETRSSSSSAAEASQPTQQRVIHFSVLLRPGTAQRGMMVREQRSTIGNKKPRRSGIKFKDRFARPAFSQDLKSDLPQGEIIGYKGARFEIIRANNLDLGCSYIKPKF